jgi:hypothetical protein
MTGPSLPGNRDAAMTVDALRHRAPPRTRHSPSEPKIAIFRVPFGQRMDSTAAGAVSRPLIHLRTRTSKFVHKRTPGE